MGSLAAYLVAPEKSALPALTAAVRNWNRCSDGSQLAIFPAQKVTAIDKAMVEFRIEPARRFRLIAEPVK